MKTRIAIAVSLITILAVAFAYGQTSPRLGTVPIPYKFMVGKKELPAGTYRIEKVPGNNAALAIRSVDGKTFQYMPIIERLAETDPSVKHSARVVFDTVGDQKFLSEFWPADNADGYLLHVTKGEQKHVIVEEK